MSLTFPRRLWLLAVLAAPICAVLFLTTIDALPWPMSVREIMPASSPALSMTQVHAVPFCHAASVIGGTNSAAWSAVLGMGSGTRCRARDPGRLR